MKLGIHIPLEFFLPNQAIGLSKLAEHAGLDHVVVNDHLHLPNRPGVSEAWTVLAGIAAETERIRLGPSVTPLPLRHPFLLAKLAATIDQLSNGRLLMGVGAGWNREEFQFIQVPFLKHAKRLKQTEEALQVLLQMFTKTKITFQGDFYQIMGTTLEPKTIQQPYPPIFLGGGSLAILDLTVRYGKGWMPFAPSAIGLARRIEQLAERLAANKRSLRELEIIPSILLQFGKSPKGAKKLLHVLSKPPDETRMILGSPSDCLTRIQEYADAGATHLALRLLHPDSAEADINTIAHEMIPSL